MRRANDPYMPQAMFVRALKPDFQVFNQGSKGKFKRRDRR
jgi:hypothetical protein